MTLPWYFYVDEAFHRLFKHYGSVNGVGRRFCNWVERRYQRDGRPQTPITCMTKMNQSTTSSSVGPVKFLCGCSECRDA